MARAVRVFAAPFAARLAVPLLLLSAAGCDYALYEYKYRGTLLNQDGAPAAGEQLVVEPAPSLTGRHVSAPDSGDAVVTTDQDGRFQGVFRRTDVHYSASFPVGPAPRLAGVLLWLRRGGGWLPTLVPLDENVQKRGYRAGREIDLPPVIPRGSAAPPVTSPPR